MLHSRLRSRGIIGTRNKLIRRKNMGFSVLMSVYEKEKPQYLREALKSVIDQSLQPDQIVLVEDGRLPDELEDVVKEFEVRLNEDGREPEEKELGQLLTKLDVVRLPQNQKLGRALAEGLRRCDNELVARMDTDDIAEPDRFEIQYRYMIEHPETAVSGGLMEEFDPEDDSYRKIKTMPTGKAAIAKYSRYRNPVNHMTVMFRKTEVEAAGGYRHYPYLEDYDLWIRMMARGCGFSNIDKVFVKARTERNIYKRRGGMDYCRQYMKLRKEQRSLGLLNSREYMTAVLLTMGMTLQPSWMRKLVYQKALRK